MPAPKTRQQLEQLTFLKENGYEIPDALVGLVQEAEWKRQGIVEVWGCKCKDFRYESQVPIREMYCPVGHAMKKVYPR